MKKIIFKILCLTLVAANIMAFSSVSAIASDTPTTNQGFIPSDDSTWGDLYRYFDPEGFSALPPEVKQVYNSTLLNNDTASPTHATSTPDQVSASTTITFLPKEEAATQNSGSDLEIVSASTTITFLPKEEVEAQSRGSDLELANFTLNLAPGTNSISYTGFIASTIPCPKLGIAVTLYNEDGIYVDFNSESEKGSIFCSIAGTFDDLESKTTYTAHGLALVTPPPGYIAPPGYLFLECTTK